VLHIVDFIEHRNQLHIAAALVRWVLSTHYIMKKAIFWSLFLLR